VTGQREEERAAAAVGAGQLGLPQRTQRGLATTEEAAALAWATSDGCREAAGVAGALAGPAVAVAAALAGVAGLRMRRSPAGEERSVGLHGHREFELPGSAANFEILINDPPIQATRSTGRPSDRNRTIQQIWKAALHVSIHNLS